MPRQISKTDANGAVKAPRKPTVTLAMRLCDAYETLALRSETYNAVKNLADIPSAVLAAIKADYDLANEKMQSLIAETRNRKVS